MSKVTSESEVDLSAELQALKTDLLAVKADIGRLSSAAVGQGREAAGTVKQQVSDEFDQSVQCARDYVQQRPFTAAAIALGVGMLAGVILGRR